MHWDIGSAQCLSEAAATGLAHDLRNGRSEANTDPDTYYAALDAAKKQHLLSLIAKINLVALTSAASTARNGLCCRVPALEFHSKGRPNLELIQSQLGGQNCHLDIEFEDGTVWLARIRLDDPLLPPKPTQEYIFMSEMATLKFLEKTGVPAPKVYAYAADSIINPVRASYALMEKLPGVPLEWDEATSGQRTRVMDQLVDIFLELEKHPFHTSGSLSLSQDVLKVGGFAQLPLFSSPEQTLGPFETLQSSLHAMISQQQDQIVNGELSSLAVDNYLSHCWRLDMITHVTAHCHESGPSFFLKHFDDKGDHILVDADFNITGIIDWEFASAEPNTLAFSTPCMLWPVGDFYEGKNGLSAEEIEFAGIFQARGRGDIGKIMLESRKMQRFIFFNGGGVSSDQEEFQALFTGLRTAWATQDEHPTSYEDWKRDAEKRYKGDPGLQIVLRGQSGSVSKTGGRQCSCCRIQGVNEG
ncbi:hypothetical protein A1O3_09193 [Capronia epimyces CBS 606.96]|uniref:Aminoglycoside phosphotransferase domain-containing protein n=1 Tax=Capronia epimyces CBS 606.96 TaxID=1182542 RepID=W9XCV9_9EURO|nr:uncharacterized protein A1O3_09193 [Capronia epimyces CBS 606.96]EXJ78033.1 hypothetical protein A1O3_09193 [Capronia epimyces CBS 606.96]